MSQPDASAAHNSARPVSNLDHALALADEGFQVFPLHEVDANGACSCDDLSCNIANEKSSAGKHPRTKHGFLEATREKALIRKWWKEWPSANIGMRTGVQLPDGRYLLVIDHDPRNDDSKYSNLAAYVDSLGVAAPSTLKSTRQHRTGRDGTHFLVSTPEPVDGSKPIKGIDIKGAGGYIVAPGSKTFRRYELTTPGVAIAPLPDSVLGVLCAAKRPRTGVDFAVESIPLTERTREIRVKDLEEYLEAAPLSIEGDNGRNVFFGVCAVATRLKRFSPEDAGPVFDRIYNKRLRDAGTTPWPIDDGPDDLYARLESARCTSDIEAGDALTDSWLDALERVAAVGLRSKRVVREDTDGYRMLPEIILSSELAANVDEACRALQGAELYEQNGKLVRVFRTQEQMTANGLRAGTPMIWKLNAATLKEQLTRVALWKTINAKGETKSVRPDDAVTNAVLDRGQWPLHALRGVSETPILRPDGSLFQRDGEFDPATGYLYFAGCSFPAVPEHPTQDDARAALATLLNVFCDFSYRSEAEKSVPVAALLTVLGRSAISGAVPGFVFGAPVRGSGKTLQCNAISLVATGRYANLPTFPNTDEELEKMIGGYARMGARLFVFDNVPLGRAFGGAPLDKALTSNDTIDVRVLGKSEISTCPWNAVILATGNNVEFFGDTARRCLLANLQVNEENPEQRTGFTHHPLADWVLQHRGELVCAALTVLRAYIAAGKPQVAIQDWGSFSGWQALISAAIVFAGGADPSKAQAASDEDVEPEKQLLRQFIEAWPSSLVATKTKDLLTLARTDAPTLFDAIQEIAPLDTKGKDRSRTLGDFLKSNRGRVVGGKKIIIDGKTDGANRWCVIAA